MMQLKQNIFIFDLQTSHKFEVQDSDDLRKASFHRRINIIKLNEANTYKNLSEWFSASLGVFTCAELRSVVRICYKILVRFSYIFEHYE